MTEKLELQSYRDKHVFTLLLIKFLQYLTLIIGVCLFLWLGLLLWRPDIGENGIYNGFMFSGLYFLFLTGVNLFYFSYFQTPLPIFGILLTILPANYCLGWMMKNSMAITLGPLPWGVFWGILWFLFLGAYGNSDMPLYHHPWV